MEIDAVEQQTIDELDNSYAAWAASLTAPESSALRCYQSSELAYRLVNGVLRGSVDIAALDSYETALVADVTSGLSSALGKGALGSPATVWRGVSSLEATTTSSNHSYVGGLGLDGTIIPIDGLDRSTVERVTGLPTASLMHLRDLADTLAHGDTHTAPSEPSSAAPIATSARKTPAIDPSTGLGGIA